ncbi:MAG: T9SS type A sorting domain-containing protein, partial [Aureispira sp.]|nr:T9SS type A sorting domain-containing protein [Aureispira sp.]
KQIARPGSSYRIVVEQPLGYPSVLGDPSSSIAIDGCRTNPDGTFNTIFLSQFNNDNSSPFIANDCQSSIGAYDPNDKRGFPMGYDDEHYIFSNTAINYHIRFQNTGTDTAFTVKIIDTLSTYLDPTSIQAGASSHPYTWELDQQGIISFTFNNIMLPDSNINEPASHGFVKFKINQKIANEDDTRIENRAAIYFDFNEPVLTNTTWHTIGSDFILIADQLPDVERNQVQVQIAPNPIQNTATISLEGLEGQRVDFQLLDATGRLILEIREQRDQFQLDRKNLSNGMYFYAIRHKGKLVASGKLIAR